MGEVDEVVAEASCKISNFLLFCKQPKPSLNAMTASLMRQTGVHGWMERTEGGLQCFRFIQKRRESSGLYVSWAAHETLRLFLEDVRRG